MPQILQIARLKRGGAIAAEAFEGFGVVIRQVDDPEGIELPKEAYEAIRIGADYPKIPKDIIARIVSLYTWLMNKRGEAKARFADSAKEVSVVLLRDEETRMKWRCLVPRQVVGSASVEADFTKGLCDIATGEEITEWPPPGWMHAGSSHSHNNFRAFFSSTDDRSELPVPGVHFVCGNFVFTKDNRWTYEIAPSIVYKGVRYERVSDAEGKMRAMVWDDLMDASESDEEFHERVLDYVTIEKPKDWDSAAFRTQQYGGSGLIHIGPGRKDTWSDDDDWGYGLGGGYYGRYSGDTSKTAIDAYERDYQRWERDRERNTKFGQRTCVIPMEGVTEFTRDEVKLVDAERTFRAWVQEEYGKGVLIERTVYYFKGNVPDEDLLLAPMWVPGKDTTYIVVEEADEPVNKWAKKQRRYLKRLEQETTRKQAPALPDKVVVHKNGMFVSGCNGIAHTDFTHEEIMDLIRAWMRDEKTRDSVRRGFGTGLAEVQHAEQKERISKK